MHRVVCLLIPRGEQVLSTLMQAGFDVVELGPRDAKSLLEFIEDSMDEQGVVGFGKPRCPIFWRVRSRSRGS